MGKVRHANTSGSKDRAGQRPLSSFAGPNLSVKKNGADDPDYPNSSLDAGLSTLLYFWRDDSEPAVSPTRQQGSGAGLALLHRTVRQEG